MNSPIKLFLARNRELLVKKRGLPSVGKNPLEQSFSAEVEKVNEGFRIYGNEIYQLDKLIDENLPKNSLGGGSPAKFRPFPICKTFIKDSFKRFDYSEYSLAAGETFYKCHVLEYLKANGFIDKSKKDITEDNLIFTVSTTQAFNFIIKTICKPRDVIIMTGPNYGLFSFAPERYGVTVRILNLESKDEYLPNPQKLNKLIKQINNELHIKYRDSEYVPRVVAFLNINPHNPLGTVIGESRVALLKEIGYVCKSNDVFVIDDLIYRDLSFATEELAKPIASINGMLDNTITMFGLSKAYGLAGLRAGIIYANETVIRGVRNCIFQNMDSPPMLQASALAGAFNNTVKRRKIYNKYFGKLRNIYLFRFNLLKALIDGIESVESKYRNKIINEIKRYIKDEERVGCLLKGIPNVNILRGAEVKAGFFVLVDFSNLKNKTARNYVITNETELLKYLYQYGRIKFIIGKSISWPNENQLIGRFTFALETKEIIRAMECLNKLIGELK